MTGARPPSPGAWAWSSGPAARLTAGLRPVLRAVIPARGGEHRLPVPSIVARYGPERSGRPPVVDVHLPRSPSGASLVLVHGGGYVLGSRRMPAIAALTAGLVRRGVAVVAFDYRMIGRGGRYPEALDDTRATLDWWSARVSALGLDPERVAIGGLSAGAPLALTAADARCHARIGVYGVYDFLDLPAWAGRVGPRLLFRTWDRDVWASHSPCRVLGSDVPTLLMHGSDDTTVPAVHTDRLTGFLEANGRRVGTIRYPGERHAFLADPDRPAWGPAVDAIHAVIHGADPVGVAGAHPQAPPGS